MQRVYLDYAAATPLDPYAAKKMRRFLTSLYGNPSSIHEEGRIARHVVENARQTIADILGARPSEIIFTGSGTESIALALYGIMGMYPSTRFVTTAIEHPAIVENMRALKRHGYGVSMVETDATGIIDLKHLALSLTPDTTLLSVQYVNNEIGSVQPLSEIMRIVRRERTRRKKTDEALPLWFHTDACQAAEYHPLNVEKLGIDLLTLNASKVYGPKGVGMLYKKKHVPLQPLWEGGGQEQRFRGGTENVMGIIGFAAALDRAHIRKQKERARMERLQHYFFTQLQRMVPSAVLNGPSLGSSRTQNNVNISIPGITTETLAVYLDVKGIAASTGSACAQRDTGASYDILDVPPADNLSKRGIRFTMGRHTTQHDIDHTMQALCDSVRLLQKAPR